MHEKLITFGIADQRFGIDIMAVREIRAWQPVTPLPRVPFDVAGVINLRGAVLPVIDLAARLGWELTKATPRNPIIVIEDKRQMRGLIVHDVADIVSMAPGTLQRPETSGQGKIARFLHGIAPIGDDLVMVLDLARLMTDEPIEEAALEAA